MSMQLHTLYCVHAGEDWSQSKGMSMQPHTLYRIHAGEDLPQQGHVHAATHGAPRPGRLLHAAQLSRGAAARRFPNGAGAAHTHIYIHMHTHMHKHLHTCTPAHTRIHTYAHTHTHTLTHMQPQPVHMHAPLSKDCHGCVASLTYLQQSPSMTKAQQGAICMCMLFFGLPPLQGKRAGHAP